MGMNGHVQHLLQEIVFFSYFFILQILFPYVYIKMAQNQKLVKHYGQEKWSIGCSKKIGYKFKQNWEKDYLYILN